MNKERVFHLGAILVAGFLGGFIGQRAGEITHPCDNPALTEPQTNAGKDMNVGGTVYCNPEIQRLNTGENVLLCLPKANAPQQQ